MIEHRGAGPRLMGVVRRIEGRIQAPPSKSLTQRALVLASLARGLSRLVRPLRSDDALHLARALTAVGIPVTFRGEGRGLLAEVDAAGGVTRAAEGPLQVGNAGTAMRFLSARLAAEKTAHVLDGDERMRQRPIEDLLAALRALGGLAESIRGDGCPPVRVGGRGLRGGPVRLPGARSSQYLSALLLSAPLAERGIEVEVEGDLVSRPYVDLTIDMMRRFGVEVGREPRSGGGGRFIVAPGQVCAPGEVVIEGDWSSASYFFAAAAIVPGRVVIEGLEAGSLQGDARFLDLLETMGCRVDRSPSGIAVEGTGRLLGLAADLRDSPDITPALVAAALFAEGETRIAGVPHLRIKETDRIAVLCEAVGRLGGEAVPAADGLVIRPRPLRGAPVDPHGDHRMAMAFAVVGLRLEGVAILDPGCVAKSYPAFWDDLDRLTRGNH